MSRPGSGTAKLSDAGLLIELFERIRYQLAPDHADAVISLIEDCPGFFFSTADSMLRSKRLDLPLHLRRYIAEGQRT